MGNNKRGPVLHQLIQTGLHGALGLGIKRRGGLVQYQNGGVFQHGAGNGDALLLSTGKLQAALTNNGVIAIREGLDKLMGIGALGDVHDFFLRGTRLAVGDIFANGAGEEVRLLEDHAHRGAQARGSEIVYPVA